MSRSMITVVAGLLSLASSTALSQERGVAGSHGDGHFGTVHFAATCRSDVAPQFDHAVALLHSFEFSASIKAFNGVLASDSTCAMAYWGIALNRWTNPMAPTKRPVAGLQSGRDAANAATRLGANASDRERGYISAVGKLY
ncbi:MAG: hypothetical protein ABI884_00005, partial [Gemmatimonadota bacterium]